MASKNLDAVSVEIKVAGKACDYVTMELNQSVSMHHRFKITTVLISQACGLSVPM